MFHCTQREQRKKKGDDGGEKVFGAKPNKLKCFKE